MRRDPIGFCQGKHRFPAFSEAEWAAKRSNRAKGRENEHYKVYRCAGCTGFHVGSSVGNVESLKKRGLNSMDEKEING